jgi:hypothetical protein
LPRCRCGSKLTWPNRGGHRPLASVLTMAARDGAAPPADEGSLAASRRKGPGGMAAPMQTAAKADPAARRKRTVRPPIDLDQNIREAKAAAKRAAKSLAQARAQARSERKRKARLVRKAGQLTPQDLERIAVLKRTGWWDPASGDAVVPGDTGGASASASSGLPRGPDAETASSAVTTGVARDEGAAATAMSAAPLVEVRPPERGVSNGGMSVAREPEADDEAAREPEADDEAERTPEADDESHI